MAWYNPCLDFGDSASPRGVQETSLVLGMPARQVMRRMVWGIGFIYSHRGRLNLGVGVWSGAMVPVPQPDPVARVTLMLALGYGQG